MMVSVVRDGTDLPYATRARTVGEFLTEREIVLGPRESTFPATDAPLVDGLRIVVAPAAVALPDSAMPRVTAWTTHRVVGFAPSLVHRKDPRLALGTTRVVDAGRPGVRAYTYRFVRRGNEKPVRTLLASRIVRMPRVRIIAHGVATYASLARIAEHGFESAMHFAGAAIHMIATAYTAGCYGCSGITASGARAGFGVIAVDPRVIPLGTKLYVSGYGRAVAGDTGGSILGHRVDLGMNTLHDALNFGRRSVNVYVLR
ncbi:MAG: hypothetical protein NVS2B3_07980 [Vulcanimicrobiaceae bacterium]